jgi:hypothetical protein
MFEGCSSLTDVNFENCTFSTNQGINMTQMFANCTSLKTINFNNVQIPNKAYVSNMQACFNNDVALEEVRIPFIMSSSTGNCANAFAGCKNLKKIIFEIFNLSGSNGSSSVFNACDNLQHVVLNTATKIATNKMISWLPDRKNKETGIFEYTLKDTDTSTVVDLTTLGNKNWRVKKGFVIMMDLKGFSVFVKKMKELITETTFLKKADEPHRHQDYLDYITNTTNHLNEIEEFYTPLKTVAMNFDNSINQNINITMRTNSNINLNHLVNNTIEPESISDFKVSNIDNTFIIYDSDKKIIKTKSIKGISQFNIEIDNNIYTIQLYIE